MRRREIPYLMQLTILYLEAFRIYFVPRLPRRPRVGDRNRDTAKILTNAGRSNKKSQHFQVFKVDHHFHHKSVKYTI